MQTAGNRGRIQHVTIRGVCQWRRAVLAGRGGSGARSTPARGVWGHAPPGKVWISDLLRSQPGCNHDRYYLGNRDVSASIDAVKRNGMCRHFSQEIIILSAQKHNLTGGNTPGPIPRGGIKKASLCRVIYRSSSDTYYRHL